MSEPERVSTNTIAIVRLCVNEGRADLIEDALFDRQDVAEVRAQIERERAPQPAAVSMTAPANSGSIFGGPTPAQRDPLAAAIETRLRQMYPPKN